WRMTSCRIVQAFLGLVIPVIAWSAVTAGETLDIYFVDISRSVGNATLLVSPSGESLLLDAGPAHTERRVLSVMEQTGVKQLDYLVNTHFCPDHFGASAALAQQVPIRHFVEHGESVQYQRDDEWWKAHRGPWFKPDTAKNYDQLYDTYREARDKGRKVIAKAGDSIPVKGIEARVLCARGKVLSEPLAGAGQPNSAGDGIERRVDDDAEDAQSIGVLVQHGKFRFVFLGDLTWNVEHNLFYPRNLVGPVDAYLITHHAQSLPQRFGDYYYGLSACPKSEVFGLRPRVAILSMGALGHREGTSDAIDMVRKSPGLEDIWQTELITAGGEKDHNSPPDFCASIGGMDPKVQFIKLSAKTDGSFAMTNSRNGFRKEYPATLKP
ncbi:MAG TPA: MBL fold metallo-hydrolase, partial [Pirellulaceae bacterium]|nr:MBL fold metallo-hydrolase [Pirellulaceae bacterium]